MILISLLSLILVGLSVAATFWFVFNEDLSFPIKFVAFALCALAVCFEFLPPLPEKVHFIIPMLMQVGLIGWGIAWQRAEE